MVWGLFQHLYPEPGVVEITYGYSRDHRPDLKQFVMNLVCVGDGDIPVLMEIGSGNHSDTARFAALLQAFKQQWTFEGLCVADGALYSADNLTAMTGLRWLTRVPLRINLASTLVDSTVAFNPSILKGYTFTESSCEYGGVPQRWFLIESEQRRKSDLEQLDEKIEQLKHCAQQDLQRLSTQEFTCTTDAINAAQTLSKKMTWNQLYDL
jgi:transposase